MAILSWFARGIEVKRVENTPGSRRVFWVHRDAAGAEIGREEDAADTFDPRTRPWYAGALASDKLFWTGVYIFFSLARSRHYRISQIPRFERQPLCVRRGDYPLRAFPFSRLAQDRADWASGYYGQQRPTDRGAERRRPAGRGRWRARRGARPRRRGDLDHAQRPCLARRVGPSRAASAVRRTRPGSGGAHGVTRLRFADEWVGLLRVAAVALFIAAILHAGVLRDWFRPVSHLRIRSACDGRRRARGRRRCRDLGHACRPGSADRHQPDPADICRSRHRQPGAGVSPPRQPGDDPPALRRRGCGLSRYQPRDRSRTRLELCGDRSGDRARPHREHRQPDRSASPKDFTDPRQRRSFDKGVGGCLGAHRQGRGRCRPPLDRRNHGAANRGRRCPRPVLR